MVANEKLKAFQKKKRETGDLNKMVPIPTPPHLLLQSHEELAKQIESEALKRSTRVAEAHNTKDG